MNISNLPAKSSFGCANNKAAAEGAIRNCVGLGAFLLPINFY